MASDPGRSRGTRSSRNDLESIENSVARGQLTWRAPLFFLPVRSVLLIAGQGIFALAYRWRGHPSPWSAAGAWWTVWGSFADFGCLAVLFLLTARENLRIRDLLGRLERRFFVTGFAYFLLVAPCAALGTILSSQLVYGAWEAPMPSGVLIARHLPIWGILYSLVVWPLVWSTTEELTYNGYLAPRIAALAGGNRPAFLLVGFWWAAQHSFLPLVLDWRLMLWRFLAYMPGVLALMVLYLRTKRLAPVIVGHWTMDVVAAATTLAF